jgi:hypothetical protein
MQRTSRRTTAEIAQRDRAVQHHQDEENPKQVHRFQNKLDPVHARPAYQNYALLLSTRVISSA